MLSKFEPIRLEERRGKVPFMPLIRAPHYIFLGRKPEERESEVCKPEKLADADD